jgi:hypothetical protein
VGAKLEKTAPSGIVGELGTMSVASGAGAHTASAIEPTIPHWEVAEVSPEAPWVLRVRFAYGLTGTVRVEQSHLAAVFEPLRDPAFFERVYVEDGAVTRPGEIDLAPDAMYDAVRAHVEWVLA